MKRESFAIYPSRSRMLALALCGSGVLAIGVFVLAMPSYSQGLHPLYGWLAAAAGGIMTSASLRRAVLPIPVVTIDTEQLTVSRFFMPRRTLRLDDVTGLTIARYKYFRMLCIHLSPDADRGWWKWLAGPTLNKLVIGVRAEYVIPEPQFGGKMDEAAEAIAAMADVPIDHRA